MNRNIYTQIQILIAMFFGFQVYAASASEWVLNKAASSLSFVTTKNNTNTEVHQFDNWHASVDEAGTAYLSIELDSVVTGIVLRDERLREHLFETSVLPRALASLVLPDNLINQLTVGATQIHALDFNLVLHGRQQVLSARVQVTKTSANQLIVSSLQPVMLQVADFDLTAGMQWLTEIAGLKDITTRVPVTFQLVLRDRAAAGGDLIEVGELPPAPVIQTLAQVGEQLQLSWGLGLDADKDGIPDNLDAYPDDSLRAGDEGLLQEMWLETQVANLAAHDFNTPPSISTIIASGEPPAGQGDYYVSRLRGYLMPAVSGDYRLYIAGNDEAELLLSTDQFPANAQQLASVPSWTKPYQWQKFNSQQSPVVHLEAGQRYYIEARLLEVAGNDHLSLGWQLDGGAIEVIPASALETWQEDATPVTVPDSIQHYLVQYRTQGSDWVSLQQLDSTATEYSFTPEYGGVVEVRVLAQAEYLASMSESAQLLLDSLPVKNLPLDTLELYWSFDEPSFQVADLSGHGRFGANLDVEFVPSTVSGLAVKLDADADVFLGNFSDLAPEAYTVSFWFKADARVGGGNILNAGSGSFRFFEVTDGEWRGGVNNELDTRKITGIHWSLGEWNHWVVSYDQGVSQLFKNGELLQQVSTGNQPAAITRLAFEKMRGQVDELRLYSHAFNAAEAKHLYLYPTERTERDYGDETPGSGGSNDGQALYTQHGCAACHGEKADGQPAGVSLLSSLSSATFEQVVAETMPLGNAPACDLACAGLIAQYLRSLDQSGGGGSEEPEPPVDTELPVEGDHEAASWAKALYKASLNLAARVPTEQEVALVQADGVAGFRTAVRGMMEEPAFLDRVREIYNDRLLTNLYMKDTNYDRLTRYLTNHGIDGGGEKWEKTYPDLTNNQISSLRKLSVQSMAMEPINLVAYVVANNRPFSEILTADYAVGNYYMHRTAGVTNPVGFTLEDNGNNLPQDLSYRVDELKPVKFNLPQAGILTTHAFMNRYPSSGTNRNRHRARMVYQMFLDTDILAISGSRPSADDVAGDNPTMTNPVCTGCHTVMDPVASVFKLWEDRQVYRRESVSFNAWRTDNILPPGFNGVELPYGEDAPEQWLARQIVTDPRFARATVRTLFTSITGHPLLNVPGDNTEAAVVARYRLQEDSIVYLANQFVVDNFDFKKLVENLLVSDYFFGGESVEGSALMLTPEQLVRKLRAVTGKGWSDMGSYEILYGGIDSDDVIERDLPVNSIKAAVQGRMAAEIACESVPRDFYLAPDVRLLFPGIAIDQMPVNAAGDWLSANEAPLREAIAHLHWRLYGERIDAQHEDVDAALDLLQSVYEIGSSLRASNTVSNTLPSDCRVTKDPLTNAGVGKVEHFYYDREFYTRAWIALLTHMLNDYRFLHH